MTNPTDKDFNPITRPLLYDEVFDIICGPVDPPHKVVEVDGKFSFFWNNGLEIAYKYEEPKNIDSNIFIHLFLLKHKNYQDGRIMYTSSTNDPKRAFLYMYHLTFLLKGFQEAINSL